MQEPTEDAEAFIPMETVSSNTNTNTSRPKLNRTLAVQVRRKAAKRTLPWDLPAGELNVMSPWLPQAQEGPAAKKPRLEDPFSASTDDADIKIAARDDTTAVSLLPTADDAAAAAAADLDVYPVKSNRMKVR
jgi:hypothetical protein